MKRAYREGKQRERKKKRGETSVEKKGKNKRRNRTETLRKPFKKGYFSLFIFFTRGNKKEIPEEKEEEGCMANCESGCLSVLTRCP